MRPFPNSRTIYGAQGYIRVQVKPDFAQDPAKGIVDTTSSSLRRVVYVDHIALKGIPHQGLCDQT